MKYLYLLLAFFLVGCKDDVVYIGKDCKVYPNDTGYINELMRTTKEIRENVLVTYSKKGVTQARYENEDMDDEIEAMSDLIQSQTTQAEKLLGQKYCKEIDVYYDRGKMVRIYTNNIQDSVYLNYLKQIKQQYLQNQME